MNEEEFIEETEVEETEEELELVLVDSEDELDDEDDGDVEDEVGQDEERDYLADDDSVIEQTDPDDESASPYMEEDLPDLEEITYSDDDVEAHSDDGESLDEYEDFEEQDESEDFEEAELVDQEDEDEEYDINDDEDYNDDDEDGVFVTDEVGQEEELDYLSEDDDALASTDPDQDDVIELDYDSAENPYTVECDCICAVKTGDRVMVQLVNGEPTVIGVVGWGDAMQSDVDAAKGSAKEAHDAAVAAQEEAEKAIGYANEAKGQAEIATGYANEAKGMADAAASSASAALDSAGNAAASAANAGRAASIAQAALGAQTIDWHDYVVTIDDDGKYHVWEKDHVQEEGYEVSLSDISMVYQDSLGLHILGESTRIDIGSDSLDIVDSSNDGSVVARFSSDCAFIGKHGSGRISLDHSSIDLVTYSEDGESATTTISNYDDSGRHVTHIGKNNGSGIDVVHDTTRDFPTESASLTSGICASVECFDSNIGAGFDGSIKAKAKHWEEGYEEESCLAVYPDGVFADCNVDSKSLTVGGKKLLITDTCTSPTSSISVAGTLQATIPTHDGYTPVAIAGFNNTANALAVLRAYINGYTAVLAVRNTASSATSGAATFTILYASTGVM